MLGEMAPIQKIAGRPNGWVPRLGPGSAVVVAFLPRHRGRPFLGYPAPPRSLRLVFVSRHHQHTFAERRHVQSFNAFAVRYELCGLYVAQHSLLSNFSIIMAFIAQRWLWSSRSYFEFYVTSHSSLGPESPIRDLALN